MRTLFLTSLCLLVAVSACRAQSVYSVHAYAGGTTMEHQWLIGTPPNRFGFSQYSRWEDARGFAIMTFEHQTAQFGTQRRYTSLHLGSHSFAIRAPAWLVGCVGAAWCVFLLLLIFVATSRMRRHFRDERNAA